MLSNLLKQGVQCILFLMIYGQYFNEFLYKCCCKRKSKQLPLIVILTGKEELLANATIETHPVINVNVINPV